MGAKFDIDEVYAAKRKLEQQMASLKEEIGRLGLMHDELASNVENYDITLKTLLRLGSSEKPSLLNAPESEEDEDKNSDSPRVSIRTLIENTLNTVARNGTTVAGLREYIKTRYNLEVQPNTISVTLNRLKERGVAQLDGQKWSAANIRRPEIDWAAFEKDGGKSVPELDDDIPF